MMRPVPQLAKGGSGSDLAPSGQTHRDQSKLLSLSMAAKRTSALRLAGVHEVAELLGIGKSALADRRRHPTFPKPLAELACGPVWDLQEIEAYREARRRDPFVTYRWAPERFRRYRQRHPRPEPDPELVVAIIRDKRRRKNARTTGH